MNVQALVILGLVVALATALWRAVGWRGKLLASEASLDLERARRAEAEEKAERRDRNAWEFFAIIQGIEQERNAWKDSYFASCSGASAAQSWLFRELSRISQIANGLASQLGAKPVQIDPALADFVAAETGVPPIERAPGIAKALDVRRTQLAAENPSATSS